MAIQNGEFRGSESRHPLHLLELRSRMRHMRPWAVIPKSKDLSEGFTEITYELLNNAVNRVAWWLEDISGGSKPGTTFSWSGPNDVRYAIFFLAGMKCRYQLFLPSPRNSDDYQRTIFEAARCRIACGTKASLAKLKAPLRDLPIAFLEGMTLDQMLNPEPVPVYPYTFTFDEVKRETPMILHTSGSTGPPKPISIPLECLTTVAETELYPGPRERQWRGQLENTRIFCGFPPFHAAGMMMFGVYSILCDFSAIWGPSDRPLNHALAEDAIRQSKAESALLPPSVIEEMAKMPSALDVLSTLKSVTYGGGPLQKSAGDKVAKITRVFTIYGSTETLLIPELIAADKEDWSYIELDPKIGYVFEHVQEDLYKLFIRRVPEFVPIQPVFLLMPHLDEFVTGDLVSPHPTKANLWCIKGRMDDLVILSSGEKFDPNPGEAVLKRSPLVGECILVGRGRPQAMLLVERDPEATKDMSPKDVAETLWPMVEEMNKAMATQGHITPDHIVVLPLGTKFPRTPKGTIPRKAAEEMFETELNASSGVAHTRETSSSKIPNGKASSKYQQPEDTAQAIRETVYSICRVSEIRDDEDLFEYGLDSIQAQQISAALKKMSTLWPEDAATATGIIYSNPTIRGLIEAVAPQNILQNGDTEPNMEILIEKYSSDLPSTVDLSQTDLGLTVAVTGSTGNLGCHMLNDLIQHPDVDKIICLNRADGGKDAQEAAFRRNSLTQAPLGDKSVVHYKIDLADPFLGLKPNQYSVLQREVDVVVHNAWHLDFLRTVKAFEKTHIAGVRHLVDLAASSYRDMRIVFISSIGAVSGTSPKAFEAVPEEVAGPGIVPGGNGYSQSKFVAEKILENATARSNVKSSIVRVGQIAGPIGEAHGTWSTTDWFPRMMASARIIRSVPDNLGISDTVDWIPINIVSRVVMDIVQATKSTSCKELDVFHINNASTVPWKDLAPGVARYLGEDVRLVSLEDWILELRAATAQSDPGFVPIEALIPWLEAMNQTAAPMVQLAVGKTLALSPALGSSGPIQVPWIRRWMEGWGL